SVTNSHITRVTTDDVLKVLDSQLRSQGGIQREDAALWKIGQTYVSDMVREDINCRALQRIPGRIEPYLRYLLPDENCKIIAEAVHQHFVKEDLRNFGELARVETGEVEIVNADFSLGYGGMLLLSHTNLRLLQGHRYGLCGRN